MQDYRALSLSPFAGVRSVYIITSTTCSRTPRPQIILYNLLDGCKYLRSTGESWEHMLHSIDSTAPPTACCEIFQSVHKLLCGDRIDSVVLCCTAVAVVFDFLLGHNLDRVQFSNNGVIRESESVLMTSSYYQLTQGGGCVLHDIPLA